MRATVPSRATSCRLIVSPAPSSNSPHDNIQIQFSGRGIKGLDTSAAVFETELKGWRNCKRTGQGIEESCRENSGDSDCRLDRRAGAPFRFASGHEPGRQNPLGDAEAAGNGDHSPRGQQRRGLERLRLRMARLPELLQLDRRQYHRRSSCEFRVCRGAQIRIRSRSGILERSDRAELRGDGGNRRRKPQFHPADAGRELPFLHLRKDRLVRRRVLQSRNHRYRIRRPKSRSARISLWG